MDGWVNKGSCTDLSGLAKNSMWPTSQAAGNMMSDRPAAMSAPGSDPVDPLPPAKDQGEPEVALPAQIPAGTSGKPQASKQAGPAPDTAPAWKPTTVPQVVRES